jgi:hypothetical protein
VKDLVIFSISFTNGQWKMLFHLFEVLNDEESVDRGKGEGFVGGFGKF